MLGPIYAIKSIKYFNVLPISLRLLDFKHFIEAIKNIFTNEVFCSDEEKNTLILHKCVLCSIYVQIVIQ